MAQINDKCLSVFVLGLFKYHQIQSSEDSSLNPSCPAFQSIHLDQHKLFVCLFKNILKGRSLKSEELWKIGGLCCCSAQHTITGKKRRHRKTFQSIRLFQIGICGIERQQNFHGPFLVSSWICFCQEWLKVEYSRVQFLLSSYKID